MVLPLIAALIGGAGSIAGAMIGGQAQSEATQYNWAMNERNARQRDKERKETIEYADEIRDEEKLGGTNAAGDRTYFKEGEGWVTELGPQNDALLSYFYGRELPELRSQFDRLASQSRQSDDVASALLSEFRRVAKENPREIEQLLYSIASRGIAEGADESMETAMRQGIRTGNSNIDRIASGISREAMDARSAAALNSRIQAQDYVDQKFTQERAGLSALYNAFLQNSGIGLNPTSNPDGAEGGANALLSAFTQLAQNGEGMGLQAVAKQGGTRHPIEPDFGMANAIASASGGLGAALERAGGYMDKRSNNNALMDYITAGGQIGMNSGGIFGKMTDRVRAGGGSF